MGLCLLVLVMVLTQNAATAATGDGLEIPFDQRSNTPCWVWSKSIAPFAVHY